MRMHEQTHTHSPRLVCDKERGCGSVGQIGGFGGVKFSQATDKKQNMCFSSFTWFNQDDENSTMNRNNLGQQSVSNGIC